MGEAVAGLGLDAAFRDAHGEAVVRDAFVIFRLRQVAGPPVGYYEDLVALILIGVGELAHELLHSAHMRMKRAGKDGYVHWITLGRRIPALSCLAPISL